jgi:hypothetical protein
MNDGQQADAADVLASIGRHWGWIMASGVLMLLAVLGVLSLIIGLYAVRHALVTLLALACCSAFSGSSTDPWNRCWCWRSCSAPGSFSTA